MKTLVWLAVGTTLLGQAAFGQFTLTRVNGDEERPIGAVVDLGGAYPAETIGTRFRVRNAGPAASAVTAMGISGAGFVLSGAPKLPVGLGPGESFDFSVVFQASAAASYSAIVQAADVTVLVTATVQPGLTNSIGSAGMTFGPLEAGTSTIRRVTLSNLTGFPMPLPRVSIAGEAFALEGATPGGTIVEPGGSDGFDVAFRPAGPGTWAGTLSIGDRLYGLTGTAVGPPLPKPILVVNLAELKSGMDGSVSVTFDAPSRTAGAGTLTLSFDPLVKGAIDSAIQLGVVGRSLPLSIASGDVGLPAVNFRTGTTAGTITLAVEFGGTTEKKTLVIPPAPVGFGSLSAMREPGAVTVRIAGFDNTRTVGRVEYTFYDVAGTSFPVIAVDNTAEFGQYFAGSDAGGAFELRSVFPVTGDGSRIVEVEARFFSSAGASGTGRVRF